MRASGREPESQTDQREISLLLAPAFFAGFGGSCGFGGATGGLRRGCPGAGAADAVRPRRDIGGSGLVCARSPARGGARGDDDGDGDGDDADDDGGEEDGSANGEESETVGESVASVVKRRWLSTGTLRDDGLTNDDDDVGPAFADNDDDDDATDADADADDDDDNDARGGLANGESSRNGDWEND